MKWKKKRNQRWKREGSITLMRKERGALMPTSDSRDGLKRGLADGEYCDWRVGKVKMREEVQ